MEMKSNNYETELVESFLDKLMEDKRFCYVKMRVYHAEKAFLINSVLRHCLSNRLGKKMSETEILRYFKNLNRFLDDKVEIRWQDGNIVYIPTDPPKHYKSRKKKTKNND